MKAAALIVRLTDGGMVSDCGDIAQPLLDAAKECRVSGLFKGKPALEGAVLCSWKLATAYKFHVDPATRAAAAAKKRKA